MQVILQEDIPSLGKAGDVVKVADGFGRNFLLPRKKAVEASPSNLKRLEHAREAIDKKRAQARAAAEVVGQKIAAASVVIEKQAGDEGKIFGSVHPADIIRALADQGITIDKKSIRSRDSLKQIGEHTVEIHLHADVVVPLKLEIRKA